MVQADRFSRHGAVRVDPSGTHLIHQDGTPFFYLADTAWNGALLSTDAEWAEYLDDRAGKGFTAVQFISHAPWTACLASAEGLTAFTGDPREPVNPAFFDRIERRVEAINARGMLAVPVLAWAANFGASAALNIGHTAGAETLVPIVRYQVERLSKYHVLFLLNGDGKYDCLRARKWVRVGREVFGGTSGVLGAARERAAVTLHPMGYTWPYPHFAREDWLDLYGYQSSHSDAPAQVRWLMEGPAATYWRKRPKPSINLEPVYEGIGVPPFDAGAVRRAVCRSLLVAPTAGVAYGAHGLWGWHGRAMEAPNHAGMGVGPPWREAMAFPGSAQVGRIAALFESIEWRRLRPDPDLVDDQPFAGDVARRVLASRSAEGDLAVVFVPGGRPTVRLQTGLLRDGLSGGWFDARTGEVTEAAEPLVPPGEGDWLLVLSE